MNAKDYKKQVAKRINYLLYSYTPNERGVVDKYAIKPTYKK